MNLSKGIYLTNTNINKEIKLMCLYNSPDDF